MGRFQLSLLQQPGEQPHPALLQAINLMGCYFSRDPQLRKFETDLIQQSLHEITVSLRYCANLCDVVQASSLLALYCYFNGRFVEGYRHSFVAARLAVALDLHQIPYPSPEYLQDYGAYYDRVAAFWQVYMVDRTWSGMHGILAALSEDEYRGQITTPMMWTSDPMEMMVSEPRLTLWCFVSLFLFCSLGCCTNPHRTPCSFRATFATCWTSITLLLQPRTLYLYLLSKHWRLPSLIVPSTQ